MNQTSNYKPKLIQNSLISPHKASAMLYSSNRDQRKDQKANGVQIIQWILYADDIVLFAENIYKVQELFRILNKTCNRYGLNISWKKDKGTSV